jgi:ribosomal protein L40E
MLCRKCNYDNPADALFCMKCGSKVENRCSFCNTRNPADAAADVVLFVTPGIQSIRARSAQKCD